MTAGSRRLVKSRPSQVLSSRARSSGRIASTGCSGSMGGRMPSTGLAPRSPLSDRPFEEGVQAPVTVMGGGRLPAGELVGDKGLDVLTIEFTGQEWVAVGLAVAGEEPDGVGVGLDGPRALVLGLQGAPEAPVEDQKMPAWRLTTGQGTGSAYDIVPLIRVWWSGWQRQPAPVSRVGPSPPGSSCWWSGRPDLNRRPPAPKLAHSERLAKLCFCRSSSSGTGHIRVSWKAAAQDGPSLSFRPCSLRARTYIAL